MMIIKGQVSMSSGAASMVSEFDTDFNLALAGFVFPRISAHALISALPRISAPPP